jgi:signal transduction protein with GAF and PtsI domain
MTNQTDEIDDSELAAELAQLLQAIEAGGRAVLPSSNDALLNAIVTAAARIFGAAGATIFLVDEEGQSLVFRVAVGKDTGRLLGVKIPLDSGIAGYVAMTGQPIAVSNTEEDARFNASFARSTGYIPKSILATPLISGDRVIGVMEVLDKIDANSFGLQDMELLGLFAQQAALAIEQSHQLDRVGEALVRGLEQLAAEEGLPQSGPLVQALERSRHSAPEMEDLFALAGLFNDLSRLGRNEQRTALKILLALAEYSQTKRRFG